MQVKINGKMLSWRNLATPADIKLVRRFCKEAGNFTLCEVELAVELVMECLHRGSDSGYHFLFAILPPDTQAGYACYGPVPCTESSWDLYWLVVDKALQGNGFGELILRKVEHQIWQAKGKRIFVDTSGRPAYDSTRHFYEKCGYKIAAQLSDFYEKGDAKFIYCKDLG